MPKGVLFILCTLKHTRKKEIYSSFCNIRKLSFYIIITIAVRSLTFVCE